MGLFGALTTSVAGLAAQSYALENISGNIANSQTIGFKRIDTSFLDLIPNNGVTTQLAGSVSARSQETNSKSGDIAPASVSTFMAISGNGFFVVQKPASFTDNQPVFSGVDKYTRRGDFSLDRSGFLVNGAGYYIEGIPIDPTTGNEAGSIPQVLKFANSFLPAQPTTLINYQANLANVPFTAHHDAAVLGSELLKGSDFAVNPRTTATAAVTAATASASGGPANNRLTVPAPITAATKLAGATNTDSVGFNPGDTISVSDGTTTKVITIRATAAAPFNAATDIDLSNAAANDISALLAKIDSLTGGTHTPVLAPNGAITFTTGLAADIHISSAAAGWQAMGFPPSPASFDVFHTAASSAGTGTVAGSEVATFVSESVSGGAITAFDTSGSQVNMLFRWAKVDSKTLGAGHQDTWNLFYQVDPSATGTTVAWQNVNTDFTFGPGGTMAPPIPNVTLTAPTINGTTLNNITIQFGNGLTQFSDANGNVHVNQNQQNGFPAGSLQNVSIGDNGDVIGNFTNGRSIPLARISVVTFNGTDSLRRLDGGAFEATEQSGQALFGNGGVVQGSSLEGSNADIADEFTKLIVTQQAYSANTKVITTANQMSQDLLNVIR